MSEYKEFGFGENDDDIVSGSKRFKAKEGEMYRASFVWWPGSEDLKPNLAAATPKFIGCKRLYLPGVGYFLDKGPEYRKLAGTEPKITVATIICVWPIDKKGNIITSKLEAGEYAVQPWMFSNDKYNAIGQNHTQFPLNDHDITMSCTDTQYQKMTFAPCRESLFKMMMDKNSTKIQKILTEVKEVAATIATELARDLSVDQIRAKLAGGGGGGGGGGKGGGTGAKPNMPDAQAINDLLDVIS